MDPTLAISITAISTLGIGILGKVLYTLRHNIKNCFGVSFRTPESQSRHSPRQLNDIRKHFENTIEQVKITPTIKSNIDIVDELETKLKIKELEAKLKQFDEPDDRVYI